MKILERMYRRLSSLRKDMTNNLFDWDVSLDHVHRRLDSLRYIFQGASDPLCTKQES
jgi:hypothetical protein